MELLHFDQRDACWIYLTKDNQNGPMLGLIGTLVLCITNKVYYREYLYT